MLFFSFSLSSGVLHRLCKRSEKLKRPKSALKEAHLPDRKPTSVVRPMLLYRRDVTKCMARPAARLARPQTKFVLGRGLIFFATN